MNANDKLQCVKDMNAARYDRICRGLEPLCPMTAFRAEIEAAAEERGYPRRPPPPPGTPLPEEMVRNTTDTCCALTGKSAPLFGVVFAVVFITRSTTDVVVEHRCSVLCSDT